MPKLLQYNGIEWIEIAKNGLPGKDGSPDTPKEIRDKLSRLKGNDRLDASAIKNLPERVVDLGGDRGRRVWPKYGITPNGLVNGANDTFTLPSQSKPDTERVYVNMMRQTRGSSGHYTMSSSYNKIVFNSDYIPQTGDTIICDYEEDR